MARTPARPLSPHLTIWKWGANMAASILHRATGIAMTVAGVLTLSWWLVAAASGQESYDYFLSWAGHWTGRVVLIGLSWAFFQHLASGLRHFVLDTGAGYELDTNRLWARMTFVFGVGATAALWGYLLFVKG